MDRAPLAEITLRPVATGDPPIFFAQMLDPIAIQMAAFTAADPADRAAFDAHWARIMADPRIINRTIVRDGAVIGHVVSFVRGGAREVTYWLDRGHWGRGLATAALAAFLTLDAARPLDARVAADNHASRRVLEKCGFAVVGRDQGFANALGAVIEEIILRLG